MCFIYVKDKMSSLWIHSIEPPQRYGEKYMGPTHQQALGG